MSVLLWMRDLVTVPDRRRPATASLVFGMTLRMSGVVLPVYMTHEGLDLSTVGLVVAAAGLTQLLTRPWLTVLLRRFPDRSIILVAVLMLAASGLAVLIGPYLVVFVVSQLIQGSARALYWTASQTYVVRGEERSATALAEVNFASSVGQLGGPALAGVLAGQTLWGAVLAIGVLPLATLVPVLRLKRHDPFPPRPTTGSTGSWRTGMVRSGCWAGAAAGGWEGLVASYVPVLLLAAGFAPGRIGVILSLSNVGGLLGGLVAGRLARRHVRRALWGGAAATGAGLASTAAWPGHLVAVTLSLALSGVVAGLLRTLGPAAASDSVPHALRGDALTATGTYRALALVVAPAAVGGLVALLTLPAAIAISAAVVAGTGAPTWWWSREPSRSAETAGGDAMPPREPLEA